MAQTTPKGEQIQFVSSKTGTHNLDTYLEAAEIGNRQLHDLLDDMFDATTGVFKSDNFQFRYDTTTKALQVRVGQFANSTASWTDITSLFSVEGTFSTSTSYNNFDLVLSSSKDLYLVHGLASAQTFASENNFTSSSNTTKIVDVSLAQDWAKKTDGIVDSSDYSSKAWAVGGTGVTTTASRGSSKEWATTTGGAVDTAEYSSKEYAVGTTVPTGSAKEWASDTSGAVASSEYSAKEYAQGTQASTGGSAKSWSQDTDQVNGASANDRSAKSWAQGSNMTGSTLGGSAKDWAQLTGSTVDGTNYSAKHHATEAASSVSSASTSASNAATSETNASNSATSASTSATSASTSATTATTQAGIATTKASEASTSASNASTSETNAANTLATFQSQYHGSLSSAPTGGTVSTGDLFFNTTANKMNVYDGSNWQTIGDIASRATQVENVNTAGTQTVTINYTVGLIDVFLNGLRLAPADYDASNGTTVVITGCAVGDIIEVVAHSAFNAANYGTASGKNVGISDDNVPVFTSGVVSADYLKVNGTSIEGKSASEVLSDIGALSTSVASSTYAPLAGATFAGDVNANGTLNIDSVAYWGGNDQGYDYGKLTYTGTKAIVRGESGRELSLGANGTQDHIFINTSGNVGIGTTSPSALLDVDGTSNFTGNIGLEGASYTTTLTKTAPTAARTITFPDATGTVALRNDGPNFIRVSSGHSGVQSTRYIKVATLNTSTPVSSSSTFVFHLLLDGRNDTQGSSQFKVHVRSGELSSRTTVVVEQDHNNLHTYFDVDNFIFFWNSQSDSELWLKIPNNSDTAYLELYAKLIASGNIDAAYTSGQDDVTIHTSQSWTTTAPTGTNQITAQWIQKKFDAITVNSVDEEYTAAALSNSNQTLTLDLSLSNNFSVTTAAAITNFVVTNATDGKANFFTLKVTYGGSHAITWTNTSTSVAVKWNGGTAPTLSTSGVDIFVFYTNDRANEVSNSNLYGFTAGQALA